MGVSIGDNLAFEKRWGPVSQAFTANGTVQGVIEVVNAADFYVKQQVSLTSNTQTLLTCEVKSVTPTSIQVGPKGPISKFSDISAFTVADGAAIQAATQEKSSIKPEEIIHAIYERDPAVALRNLMVNRFGLPIDTVTGIDGRTRLAVDAALTVESLSVNLNAFGPSPDSALSVGSEDGTTTGTRHVVKVGPDGTVITHDQDALDELEAINASVAQSTSELVDLNATAIENLAAVQALLPVLNNILLALQNSSSLMIGTEDGTPDGAQFVVVNNFRQQILATHDRESTFNYADFGTKNQRITSIEYSSSTIPGFTAVRTFNYTAIGTPAKYRRDNEIWTLI